MHYLIRPYVHSSVRSYAHSYVHFSARSSFHSLRSFPPASDVDLVSLNDYYNALKIPTKAKVLKNVYAAYGKTWHIMSGNQQAPPMLAPPPQ